MSGFQNKCGFRPFYNKEEKEIARDNLKKLGIENLTKKCYRELSGGQQQRVLLARALNATQKLLLLDEPVSGLDPVATEEMYDLIQKLNNNGITVIMISHDLNSALKYASHILYVKENPYFGTKDDFVSGKMGEEFSHLLKGYMGGQGNG